MKGAEIYLHPYVGTGKEIRAQNIPKPNMDAPCFMPSQIHSSQSLAENAA
jgi:hypothetical protein